MKLNIIKIVLATLVFCMLSCSEDILEKPVQPGSLNDVALYRTVEGQQHLLNTAIMSLCEYFDNSRHFPIAHLALGSIRSDDAWSGIGVVDYWFAYDVNENDIFAENMYVEALYRSHYLSIRYCNLIINNAEFAIEENPDKESIKKIENLVAQAKTLRAFNYLYLTRAFGDLVITLNSSITKVSRSPAENVYKLVFSDLEEAISSGALKKKSEQPNEELGQLTLGAARAIQAKAYMHYAAVDPGNARDHFAEAYSSAKAVIESGEYSLMTTYDQLWQFESKFGDESIFEIGYPEPGENYLQHHWWASWMRPLYIYKKGTRENVGTDSYRGWGHNTPSQDFVNSFHPGDPRLYWSVFFPGDSTAGLTEGDDRREICFVASESGYYFRKTNPEEYIPSVKSFLGFKLIRYADLLLLAAEAANEIEQTADALKWLEMVRARARNTPAPYQHEDDVIEGIPVEITTTDQAVLRDSIRHERRIELGGEGERFYDLKRWHGTHGYNLKEIIENAAKIPGPDYLETTNNDLSGKPRQPKSATVDLPKDLLLPIPQSEINLNNGVIKQNEGY